MATSGNRPGVAAAAVAWLVLVCLALPGLAAPVSAAWAAGDAKLFGRTATKKSNVDIFKQWTKARAKIKAEESNPGSACGRVGACKYKAWQQFQEQHKATPQSRLLKLVNDYVNRGTYITDPRNWHVPDYWESPGEWFRKYGDCEDYAITKYVTLKQLGWSVDDLRIVIVQDLNLRVPHAVLVVYVDEKPMLLDNQIAVLFDPNRVRHYRPIYMMNETDWWRFSSRR